MQNKTRFAFTLLAFAALAWAACQQDPGPDPNPDPGNLTLSYGDSILYLRNTGGDYVVNPRSLSKPGKFSAWPIGLKLDEATGAINVTQSESGLRYKVMFVPDGTRDTISTKVVISGINYKDHYHIQSLYDSLSRPFYNANFTQFSLPSGCAFDVTGEIRAKGLAIDPVTGIINLNQTLRNGFLGSYPPVNTAKREEEFYYRIPDASGSALNKISIKLYFYNNEAAVEGDIVQLLDERQTMFLRMAQGNYDPPAASSTARPGVASRPRPPCVIILGQR